MHKYTPCVRCSFVRVSFVNIFFCLFSVVLSSSSSLFSSSSFSFGIARTVELLPLHALKVQALLLHKPGGQQRVLLLHAVLPSVALQQLLKLFMIYKEKESEELKKKKKKKKEKKRKEKKGEKT